MMARDDCECESGVEFFGGPHHHLGNIERASHCIQCGSSHRSGECKAKEKP
jgi:hypothetical protein